MDVREVKEVLKLKDGYRTKEFERQVKLSDHRFGLQKALFALKDKMAIHRHTERIELIKVKRIE